MADHWMPTITLPLTEEQFRQLPRHPAYKYEYVNGKAVLSPWSKHYHALLALTERPVDPEVALRPVRISDWIELVPVFAAAFRTIQPYGSLDDETRCLAAEEALERTRSGGDGPWIERASFVAVEGERAIGGAFVTLLPQGDPCDWDNYRWNDPPPPDCIARCLGRPHLTWIFVSPWHAGRNTGTTLLAAVVNELRAMGFTELLTTFVIGNTSSMLWHWRNGFELLSYPGSKRRRK